MTSLKLRGALMSGLALLAWQAPAAAQSSSPLSLEDALQRSGVAGPEGSIATNPRIVGPQEDIQAAQALVRQAGLRPNPEVSLEVEDFAGTGDLSGLQATEVTLAASLPIERGGKRQARLRAAETEVRVAELRGELALADLGLIVRERYVGAVGAQARVELAEDILERNRELARIAGALVEAGREPPLRRLRAQAALAEAEAELKAAQAEALASRLALASLWAEEAAPQISPTFPNIDPPDELLVGYEALQPRLAAAEREALQAAAARERTLRVPDPIVSAGVRRIQEYDDQAFLVGVSIPLPLRNRNQGNVAAAEARARGAAAREAVTLADFRQEVAQARADYLAAEAQADTLESESLPQAEEALRLSQIGYRNGRFPLLEVLSAAEARDNIRRSLIDAREQKDRAAARLIRLAGQ